MTVFSEAAMAAKLARHDATRSNGDFVYLQLATGTANGCGHSQFLSAASLAIACRKYSSNDVVNIFALYKHRLID